MLCTGIIQELHAEIIQASQRGKYTVPGGYQIYLDDMKQLENSYKEGRAKGVMKQKVWINFLADQEIKRQEILVLDNLIDQHAKEIEG